MNAIKHKKKVLAQAYIKFKRPKRVLCGHWSVEMAEELQVMHGLDVESELARILTE
jgi:hypothetical protein